MYIESVMNLQGKRALVTGANRGIGFELCRHLAAEGASVIAGVRRKAEETRDALSAEGIDVSMLFIDTSDVRSVQSALSTLQQPVDILINNAAILDRGSILGLSDEEVDRVIRTNLIGPMLLAKNLSRGMVERKWGRIVNVTSGMG